MTRQLAAVLALAAAWLTGCHNEQRTAGEAEQPAPTPGLRTDPQPPSIPATAAGTPMLRVIEEARIQTAANPGSSEAWGRLAMTFDAGEFREQARQCYSRAASLETNSARWLHLLGVTELQDEFDAAVTHLTRATELVGTTNDAPRVRLAQALVEHGRFAEAEPHLAALEALRPGHAAARLELARIRLAEGRLSEIPRLLEPCLTNPFVARSAILLLGQVSARLGQAETAAAMAARFASLPKSFDWPDPFLREVQALRSGSEQTADRVNALLAQRRLAEADDLLRSWLQRSPEDAEGLLLSGRSLLMQRQCPAAEERFRAHLRISEDSLNGLIQLGLALLCQQKWAEATTVLEKAIRLKPDFAQAHANLAVARSRSGDTAGAILGYREALRCSPGDVTSHNGLAEELIRAGRPEEARSEVQKALALDPRNARARTLLERLAGNPP